MDADEFSITMTEIISRDDDTTATQGPGARAAAKAWLRALRLTAPIAQQSHAHLSGRRRGIGGAVRRRTGARFRCRNAELSRAAGSLQPLCALGAGHGIGKGDAVCLLMPNRPEYMAVWCGIGRAGGVVALLNTHLVGASLAHCIDAVAPRHIIVARDLLEAFRSRSAASVDAMPSCGRMATAIRIARHRRRRSRSSRATRLDARSGPEVTARRSRALSSTPPAPPACRRRRSSAISG